MIGQGLVRTPFFIRRADVRNDLMPRVFTDISLPEGRCPGAVESFLLVVEDNQLMSRQRYQDRAAG